MQICFVLEIKTHRTRDYRYIHRCDLNKPLLHLYVFRYIVKHHIIQLLKQINKLVLGIIYILAYQTAE